MTLSLSIFSPDRIQNSKEKKNFSERMWRIHHNIASITLLNEKPLSRWLVSIVILIPKDAGKSKINRLRIMNTYESDYNLILKHFWPKVGTHKAENNKWLGHNQMGGSKNMRSIETACLNELTIYVHRMTHASFCIHQDDAKGCYDRIIRNHANLNNKKFLIPDNVYKLYFATHDKMEFKTQLHHAISKTIYSSIKEVPPHGVGQGVGNAGREWTYIAVRSSRIE